MCKMLLRDFNYIYEQRLNWEVLNGKSVLVTGGTGLIGSLILKYLDFLNKEKGFKIQPVTIVRDLDKAKRVLENIETKVVVCDISRENKFEKGMEGVGAVDYVFHCAAVTKSAEMITKPVEVFESIVLGSSNVLKFAKKSNVKSMVYLSSMEVYGHVAGTEESGMVTEDMTGIIDELECRSCYPLGKKVAENLCCSYYKEYGIPVKIARLAQTFGAGVLPEENRVFAQFAKSIKEKKDIVLHTDGMSRGNYCYTADAVCGLFYLLIKGENGQAYNIVNEKESRTIREMAYLAADKIAGGKIKVVFDIPDENIFGYAPKSNLRLSGQKLRKLGWSPRYNMEEMYRRMMGE